MIVVNRFRVGQDEGGQDEGGQDEGGQDEGGQDGPAEAAFRADVFAALGALSVRPGYVDGSVGRNLDDANLWLLTTTWVDVGSYRRALSAYDVKVTAVPLLSRAVDEPSAYERVEPGLTTNEQKVRTVN